MKVEGDDDLFFEDDRYSRARPGTACGMRKKPSGCDASPTRLLRVGLAKSRGSSTQPAPVPKIYVALAVTQHLLSGEVWGFRVRG